MFKTFFVLMTLGISMTSGVVKDSLACRYTISHDCRSDDPYCFSSLDEAFQKLNSTTCENFEAILEPDSVPYNFTLNTSISSQSLKNLMINSSNPDADISPNILINDASIKLIDINLIMSNVKFTVNTSIVNLRVFELRSENSIYLDCFLNNITIMGANMFTLGTFFKSTNYNVSLENVAILNNSIYLENKLPLFEFFRVTTNITSYLLQNNALTISNLSFVNNTYDQSLPLEAHKAISEILSKEFEGDISLSCYLEKICAQNAAILRVQSMSQCHLSSVTLSNNSLTSSLIIIDQSLPNLDNTFKAEEISFASNYLHSSSFIDFKGYIKSIYITKTEIIQNLFENYSSFFKIPMTFEGQLVLGNLNVTNNTFSQSFIATPLVGPAIPVFRTLYFGINISGMNFSQNIFKEYSYILKVSNYESGVQIQTWNFYNNTFISQSVPILLSQVSGVDVRNTIFQANFIEKYIIKAAIVNQLSLTNNQFLDFLPTDLSDPENLNSVGGIIQAEVCGLTVFSHNQVRNYFGVNSEALMFADQRCKNRMGRNITSSGHASDNLITEDIMFLFENNTFENCVVIGLNSYNSLISMEYNFGRRLIELHNNSFINNSLETNVNYIQSATNLIIYATISSVVVTNCIFQQNKANSQINNIGIFVLELKIENSVFEFNGVSIFKGLLSDYSNPVTTGGALTAAANFLNISSCSFKGNFAQVGGAVLLERSNKLMPSILKIARKELREGLMIISDSNFTENSADYGGAIRFSSSQLNQSLSIVNCEFKINKALFWGGAFHSGVGLVSQFPLEIIKSTFQNNSAAQGAAIFYASVGNLSVANCSFESYLKCNLIMLKHSNSTVTIENSQFSGNRYLGETGAELIGIEGHFSSRLRVVVSGCTFWNISSAGDRTASIIKIVGTASSVYTKNSNFTDAFFGRLGIITLRDGAELTVKNSSFSRLLGLFQGADGANSTRGSRLAINEDSGAITVTDSSKLYVNDSEFTDINGSLILVMDPMSRIDLKRNIFRNISGTDGSAVDLHGESLLTDDHQTQIIENCTFINCTANSCGGAIVSQAMNFRILGSIFENCSSQLGGAIKIISGTQISIAHSTFTMNKAKYGGAISYDSSNPVLSENNTFRKNQATEYGNDTASYASNIVLVLNNTAFQNFTFYNQNSHQSLIVEGKEVYERLKFELKDNKGQTVLYDDSGSVSFRIETSTMESHQLLIERANNGIVYVNPQSILLYGMPGSTSTIYATHVESKSSVRLNVELRECQTGEIMDEKAKMCFKCGIGTYSFNKSENKCEPCPENADCYGGYNISLHPGFWRASVNSTKIISCDHGKDYCLGGYESLCANDTAGALCASCNSSANPPQVKTLHNLCEKCSLPIWAYGIFLLGILLIILLSGVLLLYLILGSKYSFTREGADLHDRIGNKSKNNFAIYMRIIFLHGQLLMLLEHSSFEMSRLLWIISNPFGKPISNMLFYARCWVTLMSKRIDQAFFENLLTIFVPIIIFLVFAGYIRFVRTSYFKRAKRFEYFAAFLLIFMWLQPEVLVSYLSMLFCTEVAEGEWYLTEHMETKCEGASFELRRTITLFGLIVWIVLLPIYFFSELHKSRDRLKETQTRMRLGLLYSGYKTKYYYWGVVEHISKSVIILISGFWSFSSPLRGLTLMVLTVGYLALLAHIRPHSEEYANETEIDLLLVFITVIFCVTNYEDSNTTPFMKTVWYALVIIVNVYFVIKVLSGIFSIVKQIMTPLFNRIAMCCFWRKRYPKVKNQKKNERAISTEMRPKTNPGLSIDLAHKPRNKTEYVECEANDGNKKADPTELETINTIRNSLTDPLLGSNRISRRMI